MMYEIRTTFLFRLGGAWRLWGCPMAHSADNSALADRHYVTLIVRLTLDRRGRLIQGELVDTTDSLPEPFIGAVGLHQAVEDWLEQQGQAEGNQES